MFPFPPEYLFPHFLFYLLLQVFFSTIYCTLFRVGIFFKCPVTFHFWEWDTKQAVCVAGWVGFVDRAPGLVPWVAQVFPFTKSDPRSPTHGWLCGVGVRANKSSPGLTSKWCQVRGTSHFGPEWGGNLEVSHFSFLISFPFSTFPPSPVPGETKLDDSLCPFL